ncbi:hypothetical protein DQ04_07341040, partial [Trypanosoma grayi]|uniref:hypothetical protein n=1 Tax=Trypanosoma grayi TaxID=71804 RepID=UPI0004F458EE
MPHLPQSPQQTHSAPLLPEPVRTSGGCTYLKEGGGWAGAVAAATVNGTHSFSRGQAGEEEQWRRRHSQDTRASACLRQIDLQQTVESSCCKKNVISCSPSARDACVQKDAHSVAVIETRDNLHEVAPLSLSSSAAAATTGPTAYEMALAKYERKLLRMTQKQQLVEGKHRQEVLSRRRAVNEKYSELSRLQTATGSARRATVNHRDGSAPRRRHGDDGVGSPSTAPRKVTAVDAAARNDTPRACTLDGALEAVGHTSPSPAAHLSNAVSRKRKGGKTEYGVGGVTASWGEVPENKIDVEPTGGVGGKGCSWGDPNAAAQQRTVKDIRCPEGFLPTATPLAAPSLFCGKAVMADEVMVAGGDTFDGLCFTARPWRTPPRP